MAFRLNLAPTWVDVDLSVLGDAAHQVAYAAVRPESGAFTPSLAVTESDAPNVPLGLLLDRATGRAAGAALAIEVLDTRETGALLIRTIRATPRPPDGPTDPVVAGRVLQYLVLAPGSAGAVAQLAVSVGETQTALVDAELQPMLQSLVVVAGPPGRLP